METHFLIKMSRDDAARMLATRFVAGHVLRLEKQAKGADPVGSAFNWLKANPAAAWTIGGGLGGAGLGALLNYRKDKERRSLIPSMLTGGLAGAGIGGGIGLLRHQPEWLKNVTQGAGPSTTDVEQVMAAQRAGHHAGALTPGEKVRGAVAGGLHGATTGTPAGLAATGLGFTSGFADWRSRINPHNLEAAVNPPGTDKLPSIAKTLGPEGQRYIHSLNRAGRADLLRSAKSGIEAGNIGPIPGTPTGANLTPQMVMDLQRTGRNVAGGWTKVLRRLGKAGLPVAALLALYGGYQGIGNQWDAISQSKLRGLKGGP